MRITVSILALILLAGCQSTGERMAHANLAVDSSQGFIRSDHWSSADVRMTLVQMAEDYGWKAGQGREAVAGVKGGGYYLAQFRREFRAKGGAAIEFHVVEEAGHGVRVFVSAEPWDEGLIRAATNDLSARIERRQQGLPPLPLNERLGAAGQ